MAFAAPYITWSDYQMAIKPLPPAPNPAPKKEIIGVKEEKLVESYSTNSTTSHTSNKVSPLFHLQITAHVIDR